MRSQQLIALNFAQLELLRHRSVPQIYNQTELILIRHLGLNQKKFC